MMEPSTSLLDGDSPTGENMAVSGGAIVFSSTAMAVKSFACPRSTPTEYRRGEYLGSIGLLSRLSRVFTIRHLLSLWPGYPHQPLAPSLCRRIRRGNPWSRG